MHAKRVLLVCWFALILLAFSALGYATGPDQCNKGDDVSSRVEAISENLQQPAHVFARSAVTDKELKRAACLRTEPFTNQEITRWLSDQLGTEKIAATVHGVAFKNESPFLIELFRKLTTRQRDLFGFDPPVQKKFKSQCEQVMCALEEIFGAKEAPKLVYMLGRYGMNGSHEAYESAAPWTPQELDELILAFSDLPATVLPVESNKRLVHYTRGESRVGAGVHANALIEVYDRWNQGTKESRRHTIFHEFGHYLADAVEADVHPDWLKLSAWTSKPSRPGSKISAVDDSFRMGMPETAVSSYGRKNPAEDFAETVSAYRYNPEWLKKVNAKKYEFMKEVIFDGIEYTRGKKTCDLTGSYKLSAEQDARRLASEISSDDNVIDEELLNACHAPLLSGMIKEGPEIEKCITGGLGSLLVRRSADARKFRYGALARKALVAKVFEIPFPPEVMRTIKKRAMRKMSEYYREAMLAWNRFNSLVDDNRNKDPRQYCDDWTKSSYLAFEQVQDFKKVVMSKDPDGVIPYEHREKIRAVMLEACFTVQSVHKERVVMTPSALSAALDQALGLE
ncbi:MAG TPA: hypothetical protein VJB59_00115 [Bdellovibrionota bacterium]|nr:hypothetical protein [Bdellovibrionota bacterium]